MDDARCDEMLVRATQGGDRAAFQRLVERHQRKVYSLACGLLRDTDEARDVSQDAFLRAYCGLGNFDGRARFSTWLHRIVMNLCLDRLRRRRPTVGYDESAEIEGGAGMDLRASRLGFDPGAALLDKELRGGLVAALERLSPNHRAVLLLREVDGLSYKEIAEVVGCAEGTVMSRLFHARKRMQAELAAFHRPAKHSVERGEQAVDLQEAEAGSGAYRRAA